MTSFPEQTWPGHPLVVAVAIMKNFGSLDEALAKGHHFSAAQESPMIRGASSSVFSALNLLKLIRDGTDLEQAFHIAERDWTLSEEVIDRDEIAAKGRAEAEAVKDEFVQITSWWMPPKVHGQFIA
jgi:hypothetical protein